MALVNGLCFKMEYVDELVKAMSYLAKQNDAFFIGQSVQYSGNSIFGTLKNVPKKKKIEMPVMEDVQMGMSMGMAMNGLTPISCFPRFDFILLAMNQLINHLDKIQHMSKNQFCPRVIIRTAVGAKKPLDGGPQHTQNYTKMLKNICTEVEIVELKNKKKIFSQFKKAYESKKRKSYSFIEYTDLYHT